MYKFRKSGGDICKLDKIIADMVMIYGTTKWAEVARQIHIIHGIELQNKTVAHRWSVMDKKLNTKIELNWEFEVEFWQHCIKCKLNKADIQKEFKLNNKEIHKGNYNYKFYQIFRTNYYILVQLLAKQGFIAVFPCALKSQNVFKRMAEIALDMGGKQNSELCLTVVQSCKRLMDCCTIILYNRSISDKQIMALLIDVGTHQELIDAIEYSMIINLMWKIRYNFIHHKESLLAKADKEGGSKQSAISNQVDPIDMLLTIKDIENIKKSDLYHLVFPDIWIEYYEWYNEAKESKIDDKQYVHDMGKQVKSEFKVQQLNHEKPQMKTVRGRIRGSKVIYTNSMTTTFKYEEEERETNQQSNLIDQFTDNKINAEQMYQILDFIK